MTDLPDALRASVEEARAAALGPSAAEIRTRGRRRVRRQRLAAVTSAAVVVALVAMVSTLATGGSSHHAVPTTSTPQDPVGLVGDWTVEEGGTPDESLSLGSRSYVFQDCGWLSVDWRADTGGDFVALIGGGANACFTQKKQQPAWLRAAVGYRADGDARDLLDAEGHVVARLVPGATFPASTATDAFSPPVLTDALRNQLAEPAPLRDGVAAATPKEVLGFWVPTTSTTIRAFVSFGDDSQWTGSDGCTAYGGPFLIGEGGRLLALQGGVFGVGCASLELPSWVYKGARVGLSNGDLVFYDASGKELGRVARGVGPSPRPTP